VLSKAISMGEKSQKTKRDEIVRKGQRKETVTVVNGSVRKIGDENSNTIEVQAGEPEKLRCGFVGQKSSILVVLEPESFNSFIVDFVGQKSSFLVAHVA
jgi:hypothetical protein